MRLWSKLSVTNKVINLKARRDKFSKYPVWIKFIMFCIAYIRIPKGMYCYRSFEVCPFWNKDLNKPNQFDGYCTFLNESDWEDDHLSLLWDQCKECGVKYNGEDGEPYDYSFLECWKDYRG